MNKKAGRAAVKCHVVRQISGTYTADERSDTSGGLYGLAIRDDHSVHQTTSFNH